MSILYSQYTINSVEIRKRVVSIMKFEMHTKIISNEKEVRLHIEENIFQLKLMVITYLQFKKYYLYINQMKKESVVQ